MKALAARIRRREVSAREATAGVLAEIAARDAELGAYLHVDPAAALDRADEIDRALARGDEVGPLAGVPIALKDNLVTRGMPTTCASKILADWRPPYDATVVARLRQAGAVIVGKTNMDEFAMGSSTEHSAVRPARNPADPTRVPGGSSGGSAVAVAAGLAAAALGTDTGGSIRQPASHCGVVGLKPTYGRVSRHGVVAFASSLDQVGPIARTVDDAEVLFDVIAGHDARDATSVSLPGAPARAIAGLRVGLPDEYFVSGLDPEVERRVREAVARLEAAGARVEAVSLPHTAYAVATYYVIATAEASSNLARYDGVRYGLRQARPRQSLAEMMEETRGAGFGPEVKRRIILGTYVLRSGYYDAYYRKAQQARALIRRDFDEAFARVDVIATPVAPAPAFRLGEKAGDPLAMYLADIYTIGANLAGIPAISVPCGTTAAGLPVGAQLMGPAMSEATLFAAARVVERARSERSGQQ